MTQSVKNPVKLKRVGTIILIIDVFLGIGAVLFGQAFFGLTVATSWLVGLILLAAGLITFFYVRGIAERDQRAKTPE